MKNIILLIAILVGLSSCSEYLEVDRSSVLAVAN